MILIKNVLNDGKRCNILIEDNYFKAIEPASSCSSLPGIDAEEVIDGTNMAIVPSFFNTHTHAAMTLLRGYAEGHDLFEWLSQYIWPYEAKMTGEDIRYGSEMATKEMIQTGTTFFNDMYFDIEKTIDVIDKSGMRAAIGITVMDNHSQAVTDQKVEFLKQWKDPTGGRIQLVMAPHAIYTVNTERLKWCSKLARENGLRIHIHVSETKQEVEDCVKAHGMTPVRYLDSIGLLGPDVLAAHCVCVDEQEWDILAKRGVTVSHCPCSNMKLGSGRFPYELAIRSGCNITLGTDGASSNDSLSMIQEMKFAALFAKSTGNATILPSNQVFEWATASGARAFGYDAGVIAEGKLADAILLDMDDIHMQPCHSLVSNLVYAADSASIKHVICNGKILK